MKSNYAIIGLIVLIAVGGLIIFGSKKSTVAPTPLTSTGTSTTDTVSTNPTSTHEQNIADGTELPATLTVTYTDSGFSPQTINISTGDTVIFVNNSTHPMWVASNPHPIHTDYSAFDARKGYAPGTSYSFTFTEAGNHGYHDHLHPSMTGTVIAQ